MAGVEDGKALEVSVLDVSDPKSVVNIVTGRMREAIERIPPEFFVMEEDDLVKFTKLGEWSKTEKRLREAFWLEYTRAQESGRKMQATNVFQGVCSQEFFYAHVLEEKAKLALILRQPVSYDIANREMLSFSTEKLRDAISLAHHEFRKKPDPKWFDVLLRAHQMIDQRVNGAIIQRVQQHNINENRTPKPEQKVDMESIDHELQALRSRLDEIGSPLSMNAEDAVVVSESDKDGRS